MSTVVKWFGPAASAKVLNTLEKRLDSAARLWVRKAKEGLNRKTNRGGTSPSRRNQYPAMVSSHLRENITSERQGLEARVGTNVEYAKWLELGTKPSAGRFVPAIGRRIKKGMHPGMAKRPWMKLTNKIMKRKIEKLLAKEIK